MELNPKPAKSRELQRAERHRKAGSIESRFAKEHTSTGDVRILVRILIAGALIVVSLIAALFRPDFSGMDGAGTPMLYMLSANAQAMAAAFALVFSVALVLTQLRARYGLTSASSFFDRFTLAMALMFAVAVLLPLYIKGIADLGTRSVLARFSLFYSSLCLLLLVPFAIWRASRLKPTVLVNDFLPQKPDSKWLENKERNLSGLAATILAAAQSMDYALVQTGIDRLRDLCIGAVQTDSTAEPGPFLNCMHELALEKGDNYRMCWSLQRAVTEISPECAADKLNLVRDYLRKILVELGRKARIGHSAVRARMVVLAFYSVSSDFLAAGDASFFKKGVGDIRDFALDRQWKTWGIGVVGALCVENWKIGAKFTQREMKTEAELAFRELKAAVPVNGIEGVKNAWAEARKQVPRCDSISASLDRLKAEWFSCLGGQDSASKEQAPKNGPTEKTNE